MIDTPARGVIPVRRARGFVPTPVKIPIAAPQPGLCLGADLKNTVAMARDDSVVVSQHIGDLSYTLAYERFAKTSADLQRLFEIEPTWIAVDLHPRYLSRRHGLRVARRFADASQGIPIIEVQHHHAHLASLMAEHGRTDPMVGIVCDGVGFGSDHSAWGGEIFIADLVSFERAAHIRPLRLPGGDQAAKQTGRCAISWLFDLIGDAVGQHELASLCLPDARLRHTVIDMLRHDFNSPPSTGLGRLFDAAAALLDVCDYNHYEAMAGQALESLAHASNRRPTGEGLLTRNLRDHRELDTRPLLRRILDELDGDQLDRADLAWMFHDAIADGFANAARKIAQTHRIETIGLTGGVFCNALLTDLVARRLEHAGIEVLIHQQIPPNDGGIAFGQAAIAAARLDRHTRNELDSLSNASING